MKLYLLSDRWNNTMLVRARTEEEATAMFDITDPHGELSPEEESVPHLRLPNVLKVELVSLDGEKPGIIRRIETGYP